MNKQMAIPQFFKYKAQVRTVLLVSLILLSFFYAALSASTVGAGQAETTEASAKVPTAEFMPGEVLVRFHADAPLLNRKNNASTALSVRVASGRDLQLAAERFDGSDLIEGLRLIRVPAPDMMQTVDALNLRSDVLYAEPNFVRRRQAVPNDSRFIEQWALRNTGQIGNAVATGRDIDAVRAWDITTGSRDVVVGVVDDGVATYHSDLRENIWRNPGEIQYNGIDDDNNGYIDDVVGYDFFRNSADPAPSTEHGTHVAGIIGAVGDNGEGVAGVSWRVSLMSLKILGADSEAPTNSRILVAAYAYAKRMRNLWISSGGQRGANLRILNNSYGGYGSSRTEYEAISALNDSGILFVAASGNYARNNDIFPVYPAGYDLPNVISVAATVDNDAITDFSNVGARTVTMSAPGLTILSTIPGGYKNLSGTSMAAPHVAGAAALLCAVEPNISVQHLRGALVFNGDVVDQYFGVSRGVEITGHLDKTLSGRRLNVYAALKAVAEKDHTPPAPVGSMRVVTQRGREVSVAWVAPGDDELSGSASLYEFRYADREMTTETQFAAGTPLLNSKLGEPRPAAAGTLQAATVNVPYQHAGGFLAVRAVDNLGNVGEIVNVPVSVQDAAAAPYAVTVSDNAPLSTGGEALTGGDDRMRLDYQLPFPFPFFDHTTDRVGISTNGALYFSVPPKLLLPPLAGDGSSLDMDGSVRALQTNRMIAGLWDDLESTIFMVKPDPDRVIFRWEGRTFNRPNPDGQPRGQLPVNFEIELRRDGTIQMRYGASSPHLSPVVGVSDGEPDAYAVSTHTADFASGRTLDLTNARTVTFTRRYAPVQPSADLAVSYFALSSRPTPNDQQHVTTNPPAAAPGEEISYTLLAKDLGPDAADDVVLTFRLPPHTTFVSCPNPIQGTCNGPSPGTNGDVVVNFGRIGDMYYRRQIGVVIVVKVDANAPPGTLLNATATLTGSPRDPVPGNNSATLSLPVSHRAPFGDVTAVAVGGYNSVALTADGSIWRWGSLELTSTCTGCGLIEPRRVKDFGPATTITAGNTFIAALKSDGNVWFLGGVGIRRTAVPLRLSGVAGVRALSSAGAHSLVAFHDGTVAELYYGDGAGYSPPIDKPIIRPINGLAGVRSVFTNYSTHFALKNDGTLWGWGSNKDGLLGINSPTQFVGQPTQAMGVSDVVAVEAASEFAIALRADGTIYASGSNTAGQLGDGTTSSRSTFARVPGLTGVKSIAIGPASVALAVKHDGTVWGWGWGGYGPVPRRVEALSGVVALAGSYATGHALALLNDNTVRAWGNSRYGQLGDGSGIFATATPVAVQAYPVVAPPVISPGGGGFIVPPAVTFSCETNGAAIRYTTDGTEPTENSPLATAGSILSVTQSMTVKAKAFRPGLRASITTAETYTVAYNQHAASPTLQFSLPTYQSSEGDLRANIAVVRGGDASGTVSVNLITEDDPAAVPCDPTINKPDGTRYPQGLAYARCDYATTVETLVFAPGETQKIVTVPLVDDAHAEGDETVRLRLHSPLGATLGARDTATLIITDNNDAAGAANPIHATPFFVRMQYLDFLSREPEQGEPWSRVLDRCPNVSADPACDRILVSSSFFGSPEFRLKGFYAFTFYRVAFNRRPSYEEIIPDMRSVSGATAEEVYRRRAAYPVNFTVRPEFKANFETMGDAAFVDTLLGRYGLQQITTPEPADPEGAARVVLTRAALISRLEAQSLTRAEVLRAVVESNEVGAAEYNRAFVAMQYYGYLRRTPEEEGYQAWLRVIDQDRNNVRLMVEGFMNSTEYRLRFGQP
jgi:uncharacterized repeat protein (TIGR01451 family)